MLCAAVSRCCFNLSLLLLLSICRPQRVTQHYTDYSFGPVRRIAAASATGHGTNVIAGISVGLESTGPPIVIICISLLSAYWLGQTSGLPSQSAGIFGTAVATMGMLCTAVFVLSMNNFGQTPGDTRPHSDKHSRHVDTESSSLLTVCCVGWWLLCASQGLLLTMLAASARWAVSERRCVASRTVWTQWAM